MSAESSTAPLQTAHPISFLVIGGGIAGLACALALRRVGHHVLVLERQDRDSVHGESGIRLPPNLTKILFHWGLKDALKQKALVSHTILFTQYESGDYLGSQVWSQDVLKETRGVFMVLTHAELYDILYDAATRAGAQIRYNSEVVEIDASEREVTLASGDKVSGDVLVGADGEFGPSRAAVIGQQVRGAPTGLAITVVSGKHLPPNLSQLRDDNGVFVAFGDGRAIVAFPVHDQEDFAFQFYGPDDSGEGRFGDEPSVPLVEIASKVDSRLEPIVRHARQATRITVRAHSDLEDWVEDDGRMVLIGEAAHPFPPGTIQATAMAVEDGAVLAKLFSHLSEERQIESFLYAFQELRQSRTRSVRASEFGNAFFMAMPACDASRQRDEGMRMLGEKGLNVLEGGDGETSGAWNEVRTIFGYDCEDEADDWWVQWGLLRERALQGRQAGDEGNGDASAAPQFDFSAFTVEVSETATDTTSENGHEW
ncbi:FAD/NAD-P-binding domain-containing protein [Polyporus arcularius HHB13444]|uniref:FAD/NAD-P-binding domain-containing protein n=1 Tax=Polyporus arcularius HHB13444 TaxID=1314778 RepID=A0A5C3NXW7_9APHY|nr:FAD/NAD-P-binding domain-containing protein [Polyporus arcularius HHB13444]